MLQDKLLIIRFKRGSTEALRRIYEKYRLYLLKISAALLNDVTAAEDVVHDIFVQFAQSGNRLKLKGSLKAYLRTCVVNAVRNKVRGDQVRSYVELSEAGSIASEQNSPDKWAILKEESIKISNALVQVPFEQREVVVLHLHGDMKFRQIARLQISRR
ncbi:MAG: RNA polymerase sigma factor [Planctomycetota bacterium]|jgi:RNA polymerase sigma factor (sigma-70 family)